MRKKLLLWGVLLFFGAKAFAQDRILPDFFAQPVGFFRLIDAGEKFCVGQQLAFTDNSIAIGNVIPLQYEWTFPGGVPGSSSDSYVEVTYNSPGTYDVILKVKGANGVTAEVTKRAYVIVANHQKDAVLEVRESFEYFAFDRSSPNGWRQGNDRDEYDLPIWRLGRHGVYRRTVYDTTIVVVRETPRCTRTVLTPRQEALVNTKFSSRSMLCNVFEDTISPPGNINSRETEFRVYPPVIDSRSNNGGIDITFDYATQARTRPNGPCQGTFAGALVLNFRDACNPQGFDDANIIARLDCFNTPLQWPPLASGGAGAAPYLIRSGNPMNAIPAAHWLQLRTFIRDVTPYDFVEIEIKYITQGGNNIYIDNFVATPIFCPIARAEITASTLVKPYPVPIPGPRYNCSLEPAVSIANNTITFGPDGLEFDWIFDAVLDTFKRTGVREVCSGDTTIFETFDVIDSIMWRPRKENVDSIRQQTGVGNELDLKVTLRDTREVTVIYPLPKPVAPEEPVPQDKIYRTILVARKRGCKPDTTIAAYPNGIPGPQITPWQGRIKEIFENFETPTTQGNFFGNDRWIALSDFGGSDDPGGGPGARRPWRIEGNVVGKTGATTTVLVVPISRQSILTPNNPITGPNELISPKFDIREYESKHILVSFDLAYAPVPAATDVLEWRFTENCNPSWKTIYGPKSGPVAVGGNGRLQTTDEWDFKTSPWHIPTKRDWLEEAFVIPNIQNFIRQKQFTLALQMRVNPRRASMIYIDNIRTTPYDQDMISEFRADKRTKCVNDAIYLRPSAYAIPGTGRRITTWIWKIAPGTNGTGTPGFGRVTYTHGPVLTEDKPDTVYIDRPGTYDVTLRVVDDRGDTVSRTYKDYLRIISFEPTVSRIRADFQDLRPVPTGWRLEASDPNILSCNRNVFPIVYAPTAYSEFATVTGSTAPTKLTPSSLRILNTAPAVRAQKTILQTPIIDVSGYEKNMLVEFDYAHRQVPPIPRAINDQLELIMTSCGRDDSTFIQMGSGRMSTREGFQTGFIPDFDNWRTRRLVVSNVRRNYGNLRWNFTVTHDLGNPIFLDNIIVRPVGDVVAEFRGPLDDDIRKNLPGRSGVKVCAGTPVSFISTSYVVNANRNRDIAYKWIADGAEYLSPDDESEVKLRYPNVGSYGLTLIATSRISGDSDTLFIDKYVEVVEIPGQNVTGRYPKDLREDFEGNLTDNAWEVLKPSVTVGTTSVPTWQIFRGRSAYGVGRSSAFIDNFTYAYGPQDTTFLVTRPIDVRGTDFIQLDFDYAYDTRRNPTAKDQLQVYGSYTCGLGLDELLFDGSTGFSSVLFPNTLTGVFTPNNFDWKHATVWNRSVRFSQEEINLIKIYFVNRPRNNNRIYIDNVSVRHVEGLVPQAKASELDNCVGFPVQFLDDSYSPSGEAITSWEWSFPGATPATSREKNPRVIYNTPGFKTVTLTVKSANYTVTKTLSDVVKVGRFESLRGFSLLEDFENFTNCSLYDPNSGWKIDPGKTDSCLLTCNTACFDNGGYQDAWMLKTYNLSGRVNRAIVMNNAYFEKPGRTLNLGLLDPSSLYLPVIKANGRTHFRLRFDYAYTYFNNGSGNPRYDSLEIEYSSDCGATWRSAWKSGGKDLATVNPVVLSEPNPPPTTGSIRRYFVPNLRGDWRTQLIEVPYFNAASFTDTTGARSAQNIQLRFKCIPDRGNQLWLDNIFVETYDVGVPIAQFESELSNRLTRKDTTYTGASVRFFDRSLREPSAWIWNFPGSNRPVVNTRNAEVSYPRPGVYDISLSATNGFGKNTLTRRRAITVVPYDGFIDSLRNNRGDNDGLGFTPLLDTYDYGLGYVSGHNPKKAHQFAEYFSNFHPLNKLLWAEYHFGIATSRRLDDATIELVVWDTDGLDEKGIPNGSPGTELYNSSISRNSKSVVPIKEINNLIKDKSVKTIADSAIYRFRHDFDPAPIVNREFFVGFRINYSDDLDTVAIISSRLQGPNYVNQLGNSIHSAWSKHERPFSGPLDWDELGNNLATDIPKVAQGNTILRLASGYTYWIYTFVGANYDTTTALDESALAAKIVLYPNPTAGRLSIMTDGIDIKSYTFFNTVGQMVMTSDENSNLRHLDISSLPSGMYLISLETDKGRVVKKVMLARP
jgi:PKD repeat protein